VKDYKLSNFQRISTPNPVTLRLQDNKGVRYKINKSKKNYDLLGFEQPILEKALAS